MAWAEGSAPAAQGNSEESELEGRLRRFILTNSPSEEAVQHASRSRSAATFQSADPDGEAAPTRPGHGEPQSPRASRKRPNQAQRRQMNSQLSIPIDTGPAQPAYQQPRAGSGHAAAHSRHDQRQPHANALSNSVSWTGHREAAYAQTPWGRPASNSHGAPPNAAVQAAGSEIERPEIAEKEAFRQRIEAICRTVISLHETGDLGATDFPLPSVELKCFGSLSSGFATKASDMDLALLSPLSAIQPDAPGSPIPRLVEKAFLDAGLGARLLSRTRVPIIKLCERPPPPLREALVAEREKWENGVDNEREGPNEEGFDHEFTSQPNDEHDKAKKSEAGLTPATRFEVPYANGETRQFDLKQGPSSSLSAYYGLAKRILRRAGGRDVTFSNNHEFGDHDWTVLNCYPSLSFKPTYNAPSNPWETSPAKSALYGFQPQTEQTLLAWQNLQWSRNFGVDPASYTKELQLHLDKIRRMPPLQYISGIFDKETRELVRAAAEDSSLDEIDLDEVGQRHKIIQLSRDLGKAAEQESRDPAEVEDIRRYIELLRSPLLKVQIGPRQHSHVVPVPPELSGHRDPLEFPAAGAGVQCDINFSAHLALHNTALLRCYSLTDPRVRPMVLFVKHWAKVRAINSGYRGTLSSYGYVLMVLHYLVNVARPFICPNLQQLAPRPPPDLPLAEVERSVHLRGYNIQFWRNENEIMHLAANHQLNHNTESVGRLLRGFFEYFAHTGGLLSKQEKGWTGAKTVFEVQEPANAPPGKGEDVKEIRHRYLFAVEDPFELDHNVARTVTHNEGGNPHEDLLQDVKDEQDSSTSLARLLDDIHGLSGSVNTVDVWELGQRSEPQGTGTMRNTLIFAGNSCPVLTGQICENLGMTPADAELTQFSNGETSVRILTSVREKDVFVVQSGSPRINDSIMELLIMISACKGGSANKVTAVLPYFPYSRQSKKKSHRGAITARMLANLLGVAGVKHVITVDLHASQMQGFFKCPVDNLHAEPIIAQWIRRNVVNWREAVVVSKNAGGTKRVTSLADALKLNFGMVTTDRKRGTNMTASMIMSHLDAAVEQKPPLERPVDGGPADLGATATGQNQRREPTPPQRTRTIADAAGSPTRRAEGSVTASSKASATSELETTPPRRSPDLPAASDQDYDDRRAQEVIHGRLVQGRIVEDDFPSPARSMTDNSVADEDPMAMSHASSFFVPERQSLGGGGDPAASSDEEDNAFQNPKAEHMITLVGNVRNRTVFIVDDMIDKPGSWIAAAETVVKKGLAKKVYCIATHGVFGGDCLEQLQACECIDTIVVTNSFPINQDKAKNISKLVILDLSFLLAEAIRRNHYGESISPLFQHTGD
ncbi:Poly(A) RNA polymerase cid13 [Purpureocillium lavendulum]|uniref:Ribose-phosphate pyrophosphokinase 1 n=1 Tax=Purpureocillium lavendulum TaxID=1247861 RepID=A0AB34FVG7_9HYPO|nr:Poly(A) RNA polymerase cid13 [Purpureocillium lavendulum]